MSSSSEESAGPPLGSPTGSRSCRSALGHMTGVGSATSLPRDGGLQEVRQAAGHGGHGTAGVNKPVAPPCSPPTQDATPWEVVLTALAELRNEVNELKKDRQPLAPRHSRVNEGASTS